jgi:hypothetical protein
MSHLVDAITIAMIYAAAIFALQWLREINDNTRHIKNELYRIRSELERDDESPNAE